MPQGDVVLSLVQGRQAAEAGQETAAAAVPLLLPAVRARSSSMRGEEEGGTSGWAAAAAHGALLPYIAGVPQAVVAAVAAGKLE